MKSSCRYKRRNRGDRVRETMKTKKSSNLSTPQKYQAPLLMAFACDIPSSLHSLLDIHIAGPFSSFMSRVECHFLRDHVLSGPMQNSDFRSERSIQRSRDLCIYIYIMYAKFHLILRGGLNSGEEIIGVVMVRTQK